MDLLRELESHPAFPAVVTVKKRGNEEILGKRVEVLSLYSTMKCLIAEHGLTERISPDSRRFSHYKECPFRRPTKDYVDTCICVSVAMYNCKALRILNEIEGMTSDSSGGFIWLKQLKSLVTCQSLRWSPRRWM